ncbi:hypothetical protein [Bradyrhizobium sp. CB2312]|uniref:hypothetical protein n=1 Tax=Bradyrhizobium sp. CB2312 TaxID=3039155 RepID=UPI0024B27489|nr:hypothetical protein [Bradyrhizobium sp. CB2312]WFU72047.1 hypothetical protein QA642_44050 [Bradyrhizobium sp. CB2312]
MLLHFTDGMMRSLAEGCNRRLMAIDMSAAVIARLDRAIQYSRDPRLRSRFHHIRRGVLDRPPSV